MTDKINYVHVYLDQPINAGKGRTRSVLLFLCSEVHAKGPSLVLSDSRRVEDVKGKDVVFVDETMTFWGLKYQHHQEAPPVWWNG